MDAVSRDAVLGELKEMYKAAEKWWQNAAEDIVKERADAVMATLTEQKLRVEQLPPVTVQPDKKIARLYQELADVHRQLERQTEHIEPCRTCKYGECYNDAWCRCTYPKISGCRVKIENGCEVELYGMMPYMEEGAE